mgnify:FL=1
MAVDVEAPDRVTKVEFFAGDERFGERADGPWEALYRFGSTVHGDVVLRVRAVTESGKFNEVRKTVRVNPDTSLPSVEIRAPRNKETIPPSAFPYTIHVKASDPSGIASVDALYAISGETKMLRAGKATSPIPKRPDRFDVSWDQVPAPGSYDLRVRATDRTGNVAQTNPITIVIP